VTLRKKVIKIKKKFLHQQHRVKEQGGEISKETNSAENKT
jgi:hypothetical protein